MTSLGVTDLSPQPEKRVLHEDQDAARALAMLAHAVCPYTDQPVDFSLGHCGDDRSCTHCPFCGSADACPHILAQWCDDFGYDGPDIPLVPEEWSVPADWTEPQLQETLGDLRPAFEKYAELEHLYEGYVQYLVAQELIELLQLDAYVVSWCSDGRPVSIGEVCFAAAGNNAAEQLSALGERLGAAIARLSLLRDPVVLGGSQEADR
jgi:hypothetical protein